MLISILRKTGPETVNLNRRKAIREKCLECSGWIPKIVANCEFTHCPLFPYRSGKGKQNAKDREKAIRGHCLECTNRQRFEVKNCASPDCAVYPYRNNGIDRSVEIKSMTKSGHIEPVSEDKIENAYRMHTGAWVENGKA